MKNYSRNEKLKKVLEDKAKETFRKAQQKNFKVHNRRAKKIRRLIQDVQHPNNRSNQKIEKRGKEIIKELTGKFLKSEVTKFLGKGITL